MNPFENIAVEDWFRHNRDSPWYGRYSLVFHQVVPFPKFKYDRMVLKLKDDKDALEMALFIYNELPDQVRQLIRLQRQKDVRGQYDFLEADEYFFDVYMATDKVYLPIENIYFAVQVLADVIEDCHFFMYCSDGDCSWIDEYKITDGRFSFNRDIYEEIPTYAWYLDYYIARAREHPDDVVFMRFTLYRIYKTILYLIKKYKTGMEILATIDLVQKTDMTEEEKKYFVSFYNLDRDCGDWYLLNEKYKLEEKYENI
ncbi:hypothetical protein SAMN05518672_10695 [Chitinophaga sp. CF118]|uniref:hypothetical protein n=1 Tax=Chitinophaga sp. CF118 TaxID=1884367 RepID=UPI0008EF619C|nr:hypothetical protein [Chitinophaga sp. CF118]SFE42984.1 hypothetical protein SAMN05518672_10695 [Chitinophaga sp. CF118]